MMQTTRTGSWIPLRADHLLDRLGLRGATVITNTTPWSLPHKLTAFPRGSHQ
jgi:hypothetical protein